MLHDAAPKLEYLPAVHGRQRSDCFPPVVLRYLPEKQSVHTFCPTANAYFPVGQLSHEVEPTPGPNVPVRQLKQSGFEVSGSTLPNMPTTQLEHAAEAAGERFPRVQVSHVDPVKPDTAMYVPLGQPLQEGLPVVSLYRPALQVVQAVAEAAEYVPFAHGEQVEMPTDCTPLNCPGGHSVHAVAAPFNWYRPEAQVSEV